MRDLTDDEQALAFRFSHLLLPDDAIECEPWHSRDGIEWRRQFLTREWEVAGLWVSVTGEQNHLGHVRRWIHVGGDDRCTSSDREHLVTAILAAGQLLDSLNRATRGSRTGSGV